MNLLKKIKTIDALNTFKFELEALILELSGTANLKVEDVINKHAPVFGKAILEELMAEGKYDTKDVQLYLTSLGKRMQEIKILELYVAQAPFEQLIEGVYNWVLENIKEDVVLKFSQNPSLIGGAVISYEGNYIDLSFSKKLEGILPSYKKSSQ